VIEEVKAWQTRPLDAVYPIVYLDALVVKMRSDGRVENRAVYVAIGITLAGMKEVLGLWTSANEGAKFWLQVLTEMQNRGLKDIFIACVDGLKGFPQAIDTVYPKTLNNVNPEHSRGVPKTAYVILAAAAYRWSSDLLPLKSSQINPATKAGCRCWGFCKRLEGSFDFGRP